MQNYTKNAIFVLFSLFLFNVVFAFSGGTGSVANPYQITTCQELQDMNTSLASSYVLMANVDCAVAPFNSGSGFLPILGSYPYFTGDLNGNNYSISGLYIYRPSTSYVGLIGYARGADIFDVNLVDVNIFGGGYSGGLIGRADNSTDVNDCYVSGKIVSNGNTAGGLIGHLESSYVYTSGSSANVFGVTNVGGFVGYKYGGIISRCYATGDVNATGDEVGGFVSIPCTGTITESFATGDVNGNNYIGGFGSESHNCGGMISNCYSMGTVNAASSAGSFLRYIYLGTVTNSYTTGAVPGKTSSGFIYYDHTCNSCTGNFFDFNTTGQLTGGIFSGGNGTGKTTTQMKTLSTFTTANWNFGTIWGIDTNPDGGYDNNGYPFLRWQGFTSSVNAPEIHITHVDGNSDANTLPPLYYVNDSNITITFTVQDSDLGTNLLVDLNYSSSRTQGTGTIIVKDLNLMQPGVCLSTNFVTTQTCNYDWNIRGVSDGVYYLLTKINDGTLSGTDSSDNNFGIDSTPPIVTPSYYSTWHTSNQSVTISCTDSSSVCSSVYYRVDTNPSSVVSYGDWNTYSSALNFPADGNFALDFNAINSVGIWRDTNTIFVLVDRLALSTSTQPNLLTNSGMETTDFTGWNSSTTTLALDTCTGATSGLCISSSSPYAGSYKINFTSDSATLSQEIDLLAKGYNSVYLDASPDLNIWDHVIGTGVNTSDSYRWKVELRDSSRTVITSYDTGILTTNASWQDLNYTFINYPSGLRYIYFERTGDDVENTAGAYGPAFDGASVRFSNYETTGCMDLNSSHYGKRIFLNRDINSSSTWASTGCFRLTSTFADQNVTINCGGKTIDSSNSGSYPYTTYSMFTSNSNPIKSITFEDCNVYLDTSVKAFYVNSDVNYINFLDSNFRSRAGNAVFFYSTVANDNRLDLNLLGSSLTLSADDIGALLTFDNGDYNEFYLNNALVLSTAGYSTSTNIIRITAGADLNYLGIIDGNLTITNLTGANTYFLYGNSNVSDKSLDMDFSRTRILMNTPSGTGSLIFAILYWDVNQWTIRNLDLNMARNASSFITTNTSADINYVSVLDSNLSLLGSLIYASETDYLVDFNFSGSKIKCFGSTCIYYYAGDSYNYTIHDLDVNVSNSNGLIYLDSSQTSYLTLYDSNIWIDNNVTGKIAKTINQSGVLDMNAYNNKFWINPSITLFDIATSINELDLNFNKDLNLNNSLQRTKILPDVGSATGGNLWINKNTRANLCTTDVVAPLGICDTTITLTGDGENYYDFYALIQTNISNNAPDINLLTIDSFLDNSGLPFFTYTRDGNLTLDLNVYDVENDALLLDINYSTSNTQGTGAVIINDLNLATAGICLDNNFTDSTKCYYDWNISGVNDGNYYILVSVYDGTTTTFEASDNNFAIDNSAPQVTANSSLNWYTSSATITLTCVDAVSRCSAVNYRTDQDPTSTVSYGAWQTYSSAFSFANDGNYALDFNAVNGVGLWDDTNTVYILVDATDPDTIMNVPSGWQTSDVNVTLASRTDATSGINTTQYRMDTNATSGVNMGAWTTFDQNILLTIDGNYAIDFNSSDVAGNIEDTNRVYVLIDKTAPSVVADYNLTWKNTNQTVALTCTDTGSGCSAIYYRIDTNSTSTVSYGDWNAYLTALSFVTDGNYALDFNAVNNAGLYDDLNTGYVLVDKTAPSVTLVPDTNKVTVNSSYIINYSGTDATSGVQNYYVSLNGTNYSSTSATSYVLNGNNLDDTNTLFVKARDNADNNSAVYSVSVTFSLDSNDSDNDTVPDANDTLDGNYSDIIAEGFEGDKNVIIGGITANGSFSGEKTVIVTHADNNVLVFDHNFSQTDLNLAKIELIKTENSLLVVLFGQLQPDQNKTIYIADNDFVSLCVKDADVNSIEEVSSTCDDTNEYNFTTCLTIGSLDLNGILCEDLGSTIKISGLSHSAIVGVPAPEQTTGGSGCNPLWSCTFWTDCDQNGFQTRGCLDISCHHKYGYPSLRQACVYISPVIDNNKIIPVDKNQNNNKFPEKPIQEPVITTCAENWSCTEWGECLDGKTMRKCIDTKQCGTDTNKPLLEKDCGLNQNQILLIPLIIVIILFVGIFFFIKTKNNLGGKLN